MNKREQMLMLLDADKPQDYIPAGFFLHFDEQCRRGPAAIAKHLEYFRYTGMDLVKIQYEHAFPPLANIRRPADWANMPLYGQDFYDDQLQVVKGLVNAAKAEALVVVTLYSPLMCAGHTTSQEIITAHLKDDPEQVKKGLEIITDSLLIFVRECVRLGVDGFYASTQGGERDRFDDPGIFKNYIAPYDLTLMHEIERAGLFNILHICDYHGGYADLSPFLEYPGHIVNCSLTLGDKKLSPAAVSEMFGRPYMGGLDRKGIIVSGTEADIKLAATAVLDEASEKFMLGADCTLPGNINWNNIRTAITTAHTYSRRVTT